MKLQLPKVIGVKFHFEEGISQLADWAKKYALPDNAIDELGDIFGLTVKLVFSAVLGAEVDFEELGTKLKSWAVKYSLSEEAKKELSQILDFIMEFTGIGGTFLELIDGKLFGYALNLIVPKEEIS